MGKKFTSRLVHKGVPDKTNVSYTSPYDSLDDSMTRHIKKTKHKIYKSAHKAHKHKRELAHDVVDAIATGYKVYSAGKPKSFLHKYHEDIHHGVKFAIDEVSHQVAKHAADSAY